MYPNGSETKLQSRKQCRGILFIFFLFFWNPEMYSIFYDTGVMSSIINGRNDFWNGVYLAIVSCLWKSLSGLDG
jgi:hypothetical protein